MRKHSVLCLILVMPLLPMKTVGADIYRQGWIDFNKNGFMDIYENPACSIESRIENLLYQMTLEEKSCQLATLYGYGRVLQDSLPVASWKQAIWKDGIANIDEQLNGVGVGFQMAKHLIIPFSRHVQALNRIQKWFVEQTRLGIPVEFTNEGIHGLNHTWATPLPAPVGLGSTWNRELIERVGTVVGREAKALGYHSVYAPILDLPRDPRWGRTLECYSEDPYLTAELGIAMCRSLQQQGVASCLKHYAAYSVPTGGRDGECRTDPHINPQDLHQIYLYPFRRVITEAQPWEIMASYNDWNGEPVIASHYFLSELLRQQYGFRGYVVSDSEAVEYVHTKHQVAESANDAVRQVLEAGLNVRTHFTKPDDFILPIRQLVQEGKLDMRVVDDRVRDVLRVKFALGLFDHPYLGEQASFSDVGAANNQELADEIQAQSLVLLKNDDLLPLDRQHVRRLLVTGPLAAETNYMTSRYGPNGLSPVSVLEGLRHVSDWEVTYVKGCEVWDTCWPKSELYDVPLTATEEQNMQEAVAAAADVDVIIAVLGEDERSTGESRSRTSLQLPGRQEQLLRRLYATGKPVVLVLINGQPLTINWAQDHIPAILEAWFPHYRGGHVIAHTLLGDICPSGKLPVTFPKSVGQIEWAFPYKKGAHNAQHSSGPNGFGTTRVHGALYPFGHGLSYTSFSYDSLSVVPDGNRLLVSVRVTNTGQKTGTEVVQLYVHDYYSSRVAYESVLRGFERIILEPGASGWVHLTLTTDALQVLDKKGHWRCEPGRYELRIGASSTDIRLIQDLILNDYLCWTLAPTSSNDKRKSAHKE